jgi:hypothetical protein
MISSDEVRDALNEKFASTFAKHGVKGLTSADPEWAENVSLWMDTLGRVDDEQLRRACDFAAGEKASRILATSTSSVELYGLEHANIFHPDEPTDRDGNVVSLGKLLVPAPVDIKDVTDSAQLYEMGEQQLQDKSSDDVLAE